MLVLIEGGDGAGKTTVARRLAGWFRDKFSYGENIPWTKVHELREPGSGSLGPPLREILKHTSAPLCNETELFLFLASRAQLMRDCIMPANREGEVVVLDRSTLSSLAYQVAARGLSSHLALPAIEMATCGVVPDMTFVLQVSPEVARMRKQGERLDRIEKEGDEFHRMVSRGFEQFSELLKHRADRPWNIHTIYTDDLAPEEVLERIQHRVESDGLIERILDLHRGAHGDIG